MRLDINLASQPYEDARRFWLSWGAATAAVGLVTLILLTLTISGFVGARHDRKIMAQKRALIAERDQVRADAEEFLNRAENHNTRDESLFLNQLIERKSFSWTQVLESLEKVMPAHVHLVSINPGLDEENELRLKMTVGSNSRDDAIELVRRMEDSHRFAQTNISSEHGVQGQSGDTEQFEIEALYIPEPPPAKEPAKTGQPKSGSVKTEPSATEPSKTELSPPPGSGTEIPVRSAP